MLVLQFQFLRFSNVRKNIKTAKVWSYGLCDGKFAFVVKSKCLQQGILEIFKTIYTFFYHRNLQYKHTSVLIYLLFSPPIFLHISPMPDLISMVETCETALNIPAPLIVFKVDTDGLEL